jgi:hypothetical protein
MTLQYVRVSHHFTTMRITIKAPVLTVDERASEVRAIKVG